MKRQINKWRGARSVPRNGLKELAGNVNVNEISDAEKLDALTKIGKRTPVIN